MKKIFIIVLLQITLFAEAINCSYNGYNAFGCDGEEMLLLFNKKPDAKCDNKIIRVKYIESFTMNNEQTIFKLKMISGEELVVKDSFDFHFMSNLIIKCIESKQIKLSEFLKENDAYDKFIKNFDINYCIDDNVRLYNAFYWNKTEQGLIYWDNLSDRWDLIENNLKIYDMDWLLEKF